MQAHLPGIGLVSFDRQRNPGDVYRSGFMRNIYADCVHCVVRPYQQGRAIANDIASNMEFSHVSLGPAYPIVNGHEEDAVMLFGFRDETQAVLFKLTYP